MLDVNDAAEQNGFPVSSGMNGPYAVALSISAGDTLGLEIGGEPTGNPSILFVGSTLAGGVPIAGFGAVDLDPAGTLPIAVVANGFAAPPAFIDTFMFTNAAGQVNLTLPLTGAVMGISPFGLAAINLTPGNGGVTITNTTEVTVNP